jgi:hypothetical protein
MLSTLLRRVLVASGLAVATSGFMGAAAFAQTTATVLLNGTVASTLAVTATAVNNNGMNLTTPSVQRVKVADVTMGTNNATGLTLAFGTDVAFVNQSFAAKTPIPVAVQVLAGASATLPTTGYIAIPGPLVTGTTAQAVNTAYSLFVEYTPAALQDPALYSASIGLTVTDNAD